MKKLICIAALAALTGCAFDRADPSARSARTTYGAITVTVSGGSNCTVTLGDGAMAAADGDGTVSQPTTMTTSQSPTFQTPAGLDPVSVGINAIATIASKGIDAYTATKVSKSNAAAGKDDCPGGNCSECTDGSCQDACEGGNCKE